MNFNIAVQREQEQRVANDLVAVEVQIDKDTDMYYHGIFDGATGGKPERELWNQLSYRAGYLIGVAEYYDKQYQSVFVNEAF